MKKFVIISDSCCDLSKELREQFDVQYLPMHFYLDGKEYDADLDWQKISVKEFYDELRKGAKYKTAQITKQQYEEAFEKAIQDGYDVLSISCSSALSASVKVSYLVRDELQAKYPDAKIFCIDSLMACYGLGAICIAASKMRAEGKTIDEVAAWVEANKLKMNQECTVDKLSWLKAAGRVSAASAFFGGILSIKPIIISDAKGQNFALEKVKGRETSINRLVERIEEDYEDFPYQDVTVVHADCLEAAEQLKAKIEERLKDKNVKVSMGYLGPIVGGTCGPGTLAAYCFGKEVTVNKEE